MFDEKSVAVVRGAQHRHGTKVKEVPMKNRR
jgi:hypothetical protein